MRAYEILNEGGNSFEDVGTIHISEVEPTLKAIADMLGMPEVVNQALGSVGKSEYSGDIDIVVDMDSDTMKELSHDLRNKLGNQSVTGVAGNVTFRFPIQNYDETKQDRQPRTGKVQVDLIPGPPGWFKVFYHSPGDASKMKGVHRNLAIASIAMNLDTKSSEEKDDFDRPVEKERWLWGQKHGLARVKKISKRSERTGKYIKKQDTEMLSKPIQDPAKIADVLFRGKAGPEALESLETIVDAVKKAYSKKEQEQIFSDMARVFEQHKIADFPLPKEVKQFLNK